VHEATGDARGPWDERCEGFLDELAGSFAGEIVTHHRAEALLVEWPKNEDHAAYLSAIAGAQYYIGIETSGRIGSVPHGQALADAASLGLVCVGSPWHVVHRMICERALLTRSLGEALLLVTRAHETEAGTQIVARQDARLRQSFQVAPMRRLVLHRRGGLVFSQPRTVLHVGRQAATLRLRNLYFTVGGKVGFRRHLRRLRRRWRR
jgi:hypothetical protein